MTKPRLGLCTLLLIVVVAAFFGGQATMLPVIARYRAELEQRRAENAALLHQNEDLQSELIDLREGAA